MASVGVAHRQAARHFLESVWRTSRPSAPAQQLLPAYDRRASGAQAGPRSGPSVPHGRRTPGHGPRRRRLACVVARADPQELMRHLEKELGVRFIASGGEGDEDEEEELDDWEDVVAELGNPLDMRPARVGLMDDDDELGFGMNPAAELAAAVAAADGSGDEDDDDDGRLPLPPLPAVAAAAAAAAAATAGTGASAYLDPSALPRVGRGELLQLAAHGGSAPGKAAVALVDVREAAEVAATTTVTQADGSSISTSSTSSAGGCGGGGGGGCGGACSGGGGGTATSLAPWASQQQHVVVRHVPLSELRRAQAEALAATADYVAVAATGDHRGEQAVVRLGRVYGLRRVVLYDEAEE